MVNEPYIKKTHWLVKSKNEAVVKVYQALVNTGTLPEDGRDMVLELLLTPEAITAYREAKARNKYAWSFRYLKNNGYAEAPEEEFSGMVDCLRNWHHSTSLKYCAHEYRVNAMRVSFPYQVGDHFNENNGKV